MRHRIAASSALLSVLILAATSYAEPGRPPDPSPSAADIERYRIDGTPAADGCGGRIVLAARHITLQRARGTLFADVVRRTYRARFTADRVEASGHFTSNAACTGGLDERWSLRRTSPDELRGTLESTWQLEPDCRACTITFQIHAVRVR